MFQITQPKFIIYISKPSCVILPVAEKIQFPTLPSEKNLKDKHKEKQTNKKGQLSFVKVVAQLVGDWAKKGVLVVREVVRTLLRY